MTDNQLERVTTPPPERARYLVRGTIAPLFVERHALSPADAIPFPIDERDRRQFATLVRNGSIKFVADGRCWFDIRAYEAAQQARSRLLVPVLIVAAIIVAFVAMHFYAGGPLTPR